VKLANNGVVGPRVLCVHNVLAHTIVDSLIAEVHIKRLGCKTPCDVIDNRGHYSKLGEYREIVKLRRAQQQLFKTRRA
jgi:hypothetical protein